MAVDWRDISEEKPPLGVPILVCNSNAKVTTIGIADWEGAIPFPVITACDPTGFGRFKATHWAEMPASA